MQVNWLLRISFPHVNLDRTIARVKLASKCVVWLVYTAISSTAVLSTLGLSNPVFVYH